MTTARQHFYGINTPAFTFQPTRGGNRNRISLRTQASNKSKNNPKQSSSFSLKDSETLGNLGLVGVLGTAVVVGGALVIFNPYANQEIQQETIEVAVVPEPLGASKSADGETAIQPPTQTAPPLKPEPAIQPKPTPTRAEVVSSVNDRKPLVQAQATTPGQSGNTSVGSIFAEVALVAGLGAGVVFYSQKTSEKESPTDEPTPAVAEPAEETVKPAAEETPEQRQQDAKEWIQNWKDKQ